MELLLGFEEGVTTDVFTKVSYLTYKGVFMIERRNQKSFNDNDWDDFIAAVRAIKEVNAPAPNYSDIVNLHRPIIHRRTAHRYPTFLPWHREYLWFFESRLRKENPNVTLPYWNWLEDRKIPSRLAKASEWDVTRAMDAVKIILWKK